MAYLARDYYIGHPVDDERKFEETMNDILGDDDPKRLHDYLKVFEDNYHYPALLDMCLDWGAKECALHLIEGNLPHGPPLLFADHLEPKPAVPVLFRLISFMCEPHVFDLILNRCRAANQVSQPCGGLLPLHWLLHLLTQLPPFSVWSPDQPLSVLIDSLFLPEIRPKLVCARMLARHTRSLDQIALGYLLNGEVIPLAALLLVAPLTSGDYQTLKPYTSIKSIASLLFQGQSVPRAELCAAALLTFFEENGKELTSKFNNEGSVLAAEVE